MKERIVVEMRDELGIVHAMVSGAGERSDIAADAKQPGLPSLLTDAFALVMSLTIADDGANNEPDMSAETISLTNREIEVLLKIVDGLLDQKIADGLFIARATVSRHVANIFAKLDVTTSTAAASWATRHQLR